MEAKKKTKKIPGLNKDCIFWPELLEKTDYYGSDNVFFVILSGCLLVDVVRYQDDSVNCSCFAKTQETNETQSLFDPCACTSQDEYCSTELCLSVDKLRKKKKQGRQRQGRNGVSVQMSMSVQCTICHMLKLKELTDVSVLRVCV